MFPLIYATFCCECSLCKKPAETFFWKTLSNSRIVSCRSSSSSVAAAAATTTTTLSCIFLIQPKELCIPDNNYFVLKFDKDKITKQLGKRPKQISICNVRQKQAPGKLIYVFWKHSIFSPSGAKYSSSINYRWWRLRVRGLRRFDIVPSRDGQTDRQTDRITDMPRTAI